MTEAGNLGEDRRVNVERDVSGSVIVTGTGNKVVMYPHGPQPSQIKREMPSLLPYLPNRAEQEFELNNALQKLLQRASSCPLVCIVHGDELQCHDKFLERLTKVSLPRLLRLNPHQTVIKAFPLNWPSELKDLSKIHERLSQDLANTVREDSFASLEEINEDFCKSYDLVIIQIHLLTDDFRQKESDILTKLLHFCQKWPALISNQRLIICLFVKYQNEQETCSRLSWLDWLLSWRRVFFRRRRRRQINRKIQQQIEVLSASEFNEFNRLVGVVLPKLSGVNRTEVENWARSAPTKEFVGETEIEMLISKVRDMFDRWEERNSLNTIPMDYLAEELRGLLKVFMENKRR